MTATTNQSQRPRRIVEIWGMTPQDYAVETAKMFGRGQIDHTRAFWVVRNTIVCDRRAPAPSDRWEAAAPEGWIRVVLPGDDGEVDLSDTMAAAVSVGPCGTIFFDGGNHLDRIVEARDLAELCGFYGQRASRRIGSRAC